MENDTCGAEMASSYNQLGMERFRRRGLSVSSDRRHRIRRSRSFGGGFGGMDRMSTTSRLDNSQKPGTAFIFDIIVVRVDVPTETFDDPNSLTVDVRFNNVDLKITSSRINVVEFRSGRSYEFNATPLELKEDLKRNPLKLELQNGGKLIGKGEIPWPESFISRINDCAGELTNCDESELKNSEGAKIGCIEVIIRLQTKCKEYTDPDYSLSQMPESICKQMDKVIDPNDILFVVGEDKNSCSCAQVGIIPASDSDKSLNPTCLDLSNFRNVNGKTLTSPDILATLNTTNCSQMQKVAHQYQELMGGTTAGCKDSSQPCCSFKKQPTCGALQNRRPFPNFSSSESNVIPCRCRSDDEAFAGQNVFRISGNEPVPDMMQTTINKPRCCPVCKENLSWLPKLAACPRCGYKAVPICEEAPFNEKLTADDILKDFLEKKSSCTDESSTRIEEEEKTECRCTCKGGKLCAHCRIRKLCEDIFQPPVEKNEDCNKCERKSSELYNICQTGTNDCRPYLARVFSELRDLYDIKDAKHKKNDKNERCEKHLNEAAIFKKQQTKSAKGGNGVGSEVNTNAANEGTSANEETVEERKKELYKQLRKERRRKKKEFEAERKKFLVKNFKKSYSACKGKAYTYGIVRKNPVPKIGHKTCINGFAAGRKNVPSNMGWLWNLEAKGSRAGWKPGAIRKPIKQLMKYFLKDFPADTIRVSQYAYRKKAEDKDEPELIQKPTLHIFKKNGEYTITLRPLKDPEALKQCADPYLDMKPIQFKIIKNPLILEMRKLKRCLKDMGFSKCTCHKPIIYCYCRSFLDKKRLEYQCNKESRKLCLPNVADQLVLSDTTDSDVEFDFGVTPPAGVIKPDRLKKPDLINHGTQYVEGDWNVPPMYPREPNKYMKLYNCAIGERFGKAYGPYGEDGYAAGASPNACGPGGGGAGGGKGGKGGRGGGKGGPGGRGGKGGTDFLRQKGGGKGGKGGAGGDGGDGGEDGKGGKAGGGKVDMLKYLQQKTKDSRKDGKKKGRRVSEMPPPLLCMVDRRGKPCDPCAPCLPCGPCCDGVCCYPRCDPRIC